MSVFPKTTDKVLDPIDAPVFHEEDRPEHKEPRLFKLILLNDDETPYDFVRAVLIVHCRLSESAAEKMTHEVHTKGKAVAGIFSRDLCETLSCKINALAANNGFPFLTEVEPE